MSKIKLTGDSSGYVEISAPSAAGNNTLELPASGSKIVVSDENDNINVAGIVTASSLYTTSINDLNYPTAGPLSNRNLIINGAMQVAQRGTSSAGNGFNTTSWPVDRFKVANLTDAVLTVSQENSGAPEGFQYWSKVLVTTADTSIASTQYSTITQMIEGYNFAQCKYGTSDAKSIRVSFYFKTNKSGTYCMIHRNESANRNFLYEFVPSSLDTWERIEYTVPGDITGTWNVSTGIGFRFELCMSNGTSYQSSTVGSWFSGQYYHSTPNQVNLFNEVNNYIGITGVQVEVGEGSTPFEHRSYGQELALCQRYYQQIGKTSSGNDFFASGFTTTNDFYGGGFLKTTMRASPTISYVGTIGDINYTHPAVGASASSIVTYQANTESYSIRLNSATGTTSGYGAYARVTSSNTALTFTSEL